MERLKYICKSKEKVYCISNNASIVINQLITILYDAQLKRCKCKIEQYYENGKEYCRVIGSYKGDFDKNVQHIVSGFSNEWGNFINVGDTLINNKIEIKEIR